jgi:hypothetical protein
MKGIDGQARIVRGSIVFSVPIKHLQAIVDGSWRTGNMDTRFKVTDPEAFAKDLLSWGLNTESEDGSTPIHRMFDKAIEAAIEQGAEGIEEHEDQDA